MATPRFLKNTRVPKDKKARDGVTILLEDVRHDFKAFGDGLQSVEERLTKEMRQGFKRLEARIWRLEEEVRTLRRMIGTPEQPKIITQDQYLKLDQRLRRVEEHLKIAAS